MPEDKASPPSRAAWIEIPNKSPNIKTYMSPPSRAAWIEIGVSTLAVTLLAVAAFTGGVD